jgi:hypothetical protein
MFTLHLRIHCCEPGQSTGSHTEQGRGNCCSVSRAGVRRRRRCLGYYLESEGKPAVIDPENPDPKVADALHISEEELRQILDFHLSANTEEQGSTEGIGI